ncbi:MAG: hypothetical protein WCY57_03935, partial [Micavibrio sp.]
MHDHFTDAAGITPRSERRRFNRAFDNLLAEVGFSTKKQAILPENSDRMKKAFHDFFDEMDWPLAQWNFSALLEEKKGEHAFRADGKTPNWYHEAREILFFLTHVRTGILKISDLNPYGGPEVGVATIWRHDSWEDLGQNAHSIFSGMDEHIHEIWGKAGHDDAYYFMLRQKAVMISDNVDLLTRKYPRLDEHGAYVRKPTGKYIKDDRFGGDINLYMNQVAKNPLTVMAKYYDGIDGMFTRNNVPVFNDAANRSYNEERRMIYGHR